MGRLTMLDSMLESLNILIFIIIAIIFFFLIMGLFLWRRFGGSIYKWKPGSVDYKDSTQSDLNEA